MLFITIAHNKTESDPSSDQPSSGILYFPWPSRIIIFTVFLIAVAHFILQAMYVTRLGLPLPVTST